MYRLTLTPPERQAFDWVGGRYATGYDVYRVLWIDCYDGEIEWDSDSDMDFEIPEPQARRIRELAASENNLWPCFAPELAAKMRSLVGSIV